MGLRERFGLIVESIQGCSDDEYTTAWIDALLQAVCAEVNHDWSAHISIDTNPPTFTPAGPCSRCGVNP